jgi:hypothetical protein
MPFLWAVCNPCFFMEDLGVDLDLLLVSVDFDFSVVLPVDFPDLSVEDFGVDFALPPVPVVFDFVIVSPSIFLED